MKTEIKLARHDSFFAWVIRGITREKWDHVFIDVGWCICNFDLHGFQQILKGSPLPWVEESAGVAMEVSLDIAALETLATQKYSVWYNINWLLRKVGLPAFVDKSGYNCVRFCNALLGGPADWNYLSPVELYERIKNEREKEEGNAM